jgi:hypothetical protein
MTMMDADLLRAADQAEGMTLTARSLTITKQTGEPPAGWNERAIARLV